MGLHAVTAQQPFSHLALGPGRWVTLGPALGAGTMGTIFRGTLTSGYGVERAVAVRLFPTCEGEDGARRFELLGSIARKSARIDHPNVVSATEFGVQGGIPFCITELVHGVSLATLVHRHREQPVTVPVDLGVFIASEVAKGLLGARSSLDQHGREQRLPHGDLSMRSVLLSFHGEVKVADFALAIARGASTGVRRRDALRLAVAHLAPEVLSGQEADARSDVFSLGVMMWEMLMGPRVPADLSDGEAVSRCRAGWVDLGGTLPHLPAFVAHVMRKALHPDPARRYPHAGHMAYDLESASLSLNIGDERTFLRESLESLFDSGNPRRSIADGAPLPRPPVAQSDIYLSHRDDDEDDASHEFELDDSLELCETDLEEAEEPSILTPAGWSRR